MLFESNRHGGMGFFNLEVAGAAYVAGATAPSNPDVEHDDTIHPRAQAGGGDDTTDQTPRGAR